MTVEEKHLVIETCDRCGESRQSEVIDGEGRLVFATTVAIEGIGLSHALDLCRPCRDKLMELVALFLYEKNS